MPDSPLQCPDCGAGVPVRRGVRPWCDACGWNIRPIAGPAPQAGRFDAWSGRIARTLHREVCRSAANRPGRDLARVGATAVALTVLLLGPALAGCAVLLVLWSVNPLTIAGTVVLVLLAIAVRPRSAKPPDGTMTLRREDAPGLYRLLDDLAGHLGVRGPDRVVLNEDFNASLGEYGPRGTRVLTIGIPLWQALRGQERVALLGHELAHGANGDTRQRALVCRAMQSLIELHKVVRPHRTRLTHPAVLLLVAVMSAAARIAELTLCLELALTQRASQRAEYLADELAARVASTEAAIAMLEAAPTTRVIWRAARRSMDQPGPPLWERYRTAIDELDPGERARRLDVAAAKPFRLSDSHPPEHLRIAYLRSRPVAEGTFLLDPATERSVQRELAPMLDRFAKERGVRSP